MRLRSTTRLPERYLDGDQPDIRRRASLIERSSNYNPNLSPAAFPTLDHPPKVELGASVGASELVPNPANSPDDEIRLEIPPKKATVFHAKKNSTDQLIQESSLASAKFRRVDVVESESRRFMKWNSSNDHIDPEEYDGWQTMANSIDTPRIGLSAYELTPRWSQVSDDMKLVLFKEIMATHSFNDAAEKLMLTDIQRKNIMALVQRETAREARDIAKMERVQATQLRMLMSGDPKLSREALSESFEDLYVDIEVPAASRVSKTDIAYAQRFLTAMNLNEYVSRLWRYEGVALDLVDWKISLIEELPPKIVETVSVENQHQHQHLPTSGSADNGLDINARRKRKTLLENVGGLASTKRERRRTQIGRTGVPSRLRNCVLHNSEEKMVAGTGPTQASLATESQPAMQTPLESQPEKQHTAGSIRLVIKSSAIPQSLDTPIRQTSNTTEIFTDSFSATQPKQPWSLGQSKFSHPILRREETLSQVQEVQLNSSQADLGQVKNFIRENIKDIDKSLVSENEHSASIVPLMVGRRSAGTLGHTNLKANLTDENDKYSENAEHISVDSFSARHSQPDQEFAIQAEDNTLPRQHCRKRQKTNGDAPWRASGQKKSKFPVRDEPPARRKRTATEERQVQINPDK